MLDTPREIASFSERDPFTYRVTPRPNRNSANIVLTDRDSSENFLPIAPQPEKVFRHFIAEKATAEIGFQISPAMVDASTIVPKLALRNKTQQTEFDPPEVVLNEDEKDKLTAFLKDIEPMLMEEIWLISTTDPFAQELDFREKASDLDSGFEESLVVKELKSFEFESCKHKLVTEARFHPKLPFVLISYVENPTFDEKAEFSGSNSPGCLLFWNYEEHHRFAPIARLRFPLEITSFAFKPDKTSWIIAGGVNGQLFLADTQELESADFKNRADGDLIELLPCLSSTMTESIHAQQNLIQSDNFSKKTHHISSHRTAVCAIKFLPNGCELDKKAIGFSRKAKKANGTAPQARDQFVSISRDGHMLFWDLCFTDQHEQKLNPADIDFTKLVWRAFLSFQMFKQDLSVLETSVVFLNYAQEKCDFFIGTEVGQVLNVNFENKAEREDIKTDPVRFSWGRRNFTAALSLEVSPFSKDLILVVSELGFCLFSEESIDPIIASPPIVPSKFTCGAFSKTRPCVVFIGREDGFLDIWDFTELSSMPIQQILVSAVGIQLIEPATRPGLLAVCDKEGCMHLLTMPVTLTKKKPEEEIHLESLLEKEREKVKFYNLKYEAMDSFQKVEETEPGEEVTKDLNEDAMVKINIENDLLEENYHKFLEEQMAKL